MRRPLAWVLNNPHYAHRVSPFVSFVVRDPSSCKYGYHSSVISGAGCATTSVTDDYAESVSFPFTHAISTLPPATAIDASRHMRAKAAIAPRGAGLQLRCV